MKTQEIHRYKTRLDNLFTKIAAFSGDNELQSHWARYLCVRVSGFLEISVSAIFTKYTEDKSAPNVANYVAHKLRGFQNPNMTKIIALTNLFSSDWGASLEEKTKGALKEAVDSIYSNRCVIAHGQHSGITYARIREYYQRAIRVVEILEEQCEA